MKKLLLLSAVLISAATVAHAGVRVGFGAGLPLPALPLPGVVVAQTQCAPAPVVYAQPDYCAPAPVVVTPYCPPARVYVAPRYYPHNYAYGYGHNRGYYGHGYYGRGGYCR